MAEAEARNILADEPSRAGAKGKITQVIGPVVDVQFDGHGLLVGYIAALFQRVG